MINNEQDGKAGQNSTEKHMQNITNKRNHPSLEDILNQLHFSLVYSVNPAYAISMDSQNLDNPAFKAFQNTIEVGAIQILR